VQIAGVLVVPRVELVLHSVAPMGTAADEDLVIAQKMPLMLLVTTTHVSHKNLTQKVYGGKRSWMAWLARTPTAWRIVEEKGVFVTLASVADWNYAAKKDLENVPLKLRKFLQRSTDVSHKQVFGYKIKEIKIAGVLVVPKVELVLLSVALMGTAVDEDLVIAQLMPLLLLPTTTHVSHQELYG